MKVHPSPMPRKRNTTSVYDAALTLPHTNPLLPRQKKLRRLPHVFAKVLELPFHSDADVLVQETTNSLVFTVAADDIGGYVRAQAIEMYPGVTKVVVRGYGDDGGDLSVDGLEMMDMWRFRLPRSTRPDMASATWVDGELIVTVPKGGDLNGEEDGNVGIGTEMLVIVQ